MTGNAVRFVYVSAGQSRPFVADPDAIYFVEDAQQLWVGDALIADHIDPIDISQYLASYLVKSIQITGSGDVIKDASFDQETGQITLTRGQATPISKGPDSEPAQVDLTPGSTFTVLTNTEVADNKIFDQTVRFKLPIQISSIFMRKATDGSNNIIIDTRMTDGSIVSQPFDIFGSAAFKNEDQFASNADIERIDTEIEDIKSSISSALHYRGESSTAITDGGREAPTIDGEPVDPAGMKSGDVVTYHGKEFIWSGTHWNEFGDEGSYALKTTTVTGSDGLTGGGQLSSNVVITHDITGTGRSETYRGSSDLSVVSSLDVDKFGHVVLASVTDISEPITNTIQDKIDEAIEDLDITHYTISKETDADPNIVTYHLVKTKDGSNVGEPIVVNTSGGGSPEYVAGQGIDIVSDVIKHKNISDGSTISVADIGEVTTLESDGTKLKTVEFLRTGLVRDNMGHVVSSSADPESVATFVTEDYTRELITEVEVRWDTYPPEEP